MIVKERVFRVLGSQPVALTLVRDALVDTFVTPPPASSPLPQSDRNLSMKTLPDRIKAFSAKLTYQIPSQSHPVTLATPMHRSIAFLLDLIIFGTWSIIVAVLLGTTGVNSALATLLALLTGVAYVAWGNTTGQSLGKRVMRIRVVRKESGVRPGVARGLVRTLGYVLNHCSIGFGFQWMMWDPKRQGWHDKLAGTIVIFVNSDPSHHERKWPQVIQDTKIRSKR